MDVLKQISNHLRIRDQKSIYFSSIFVGILSGLFASGFSYLLQFFTQITSKFTEKSHRLESFFFHSHPTTVFYFDDFLFFFLPILGGFFSGLIVYLFCRDAEGMGTDSMIYSFHHKEGKMDSKVPFVKSIATIFTLSSFGSGGKEGPISQIGAGIGTIVAELLGSGARARRTLLLAGTAGGLGAIFHAPLGGAITAAEMVYKEDVESDALIPCILSSGTAFLITEFFTGKARVFELKDTVAYSAKEFPFYLLLGILCYIGGKGFIFFYSWIQTLSSKVNLPSYSKPALGGLLCSFLYLFFPEISGSGEEFLEDSLQNHTHQIQSYSYLSPLAIYFLLFVFKIIATSLTVGTGGSAGVFGPSLFAGCMLGGGMAQISTYFLGPGNNSTGFMLVGMGAFYSGVASAPIAGMIMVCEMVGNYELLPPLMLVTILSVSLGNRMTIYKSQLLNRFSTPAHFWDMNQDIMDKIYLKDIPEYIRTLAIIDSKMEIENIRKKSLEIQASDFIVSEEGNYLGVLSLRKVKNLLHPETVGSSLLMGELCDRKISPILISASLKSAFYTLLEFDIDKVPIIDLNNKLIGYLRISDLFRIYYKHIKK
jgi:chloride channel protein, CIC family